MRAKASTVFSPHASEQANGLAKANVVCKEKGSVPRTRVSPSPSDLVSGATVARTRGRRAGARHVHGRQPVGRRQHGDRGRAAAGDELHAAGGPLRAAAELRAGAGAVPRSALQDLGQGRDAVHHRYVAPLGYCRLGELGGT